MSHTLQVIHPTIVTGAGLFQCGPYGSQFSDFADSNTAKTTQVMKDDAITIIDENSAAGKIDNK